MNVKFNWIEVIKGNKTERFSEADPTIKEIGFNAEAGHPMVHKEDGEILSFIGMPYIISATPVLVEEVPSNIILDESELRGQG